MSQFIVSDSAALLRALSSARSGDVILLESGVYRDVRIEGRDFPQGITIRSRDSNDQAVIQGLKILNSSGISVSDIELVVNPSGSVYQNQVLDSQNIRLSGLTIHGSMNGDAADDEVGLHIKGSQGVEVSGSDFQQLSFGVMVSDTTGVRIVGNSFHEISIDGIQAGAGMNNVLISQNFFYDFDRKDAGTHADAIQFATVHSTSPSSNIDITDNVIWQRDGTSMQGIFLGNEKGIAYQDVTITGNLVLMSHANAITVFKANGLQIADNMVLRYADQSQTTIRANDVSMASVVDNSAPQIGVNGQDLTHSGNSQSGIVRDDGAGAIGLWLSQNAGSLGNLPDVLGAGAPRADVSLPDPLPQPAPVPTPPPVDATPPAPKPAPPPPVDVAPTAPEPAPAQPGGMPTSYLDAIQSFLDSYRDESFQGGDQARSITLDPVWTSPAGQFDFSQIIVPSKIEVEPVRDVVPVPVDRPDEAAPSPAAGLPQYSWQDAYSAPNSVGTPSPLSLLGGDTEVFGRDIFSGKADWAQW